MRPAFRRFILLGAAAAIVVAAVPVAYDAWWRHRARQRLRVEPVVAGLDFDATGGARLTVAGKTYAVTPEADAVAGWESPPGGVHELTVRAPAALPMNRVLGLAFASGMISGATSPVRHLALGPAGRVVGEVRLRHIVCPACESQGRRTVALQADAARPDRWTLVSGGPVRVEGASAEIRARLAGLAREGRAAGTAPGGLLAHVYLPGENPTFAAMLDAVSRIQTPEIHAMAFIPFSSDEAPDLVAALEGGPALKSTATVPPPHFKTPLPPPAPPVRPPVR